MMNIAVSIALLMALSVYSAQGLSCICKDATCESTESLKLQCKGGLVYDVCHCCKTCAKVEGENCGGIWGFDGTCDQGLVCKENDHDEHEYWSSYWREGKCVRRQTMRTTPRPSNKEMTFPTRWEKVFKTTKKTEQPTTDSSGEEIDEKESSGMTTLSWKWLKPEPTTGAMSEESSAEFPTTEPSEEIIIF